MTAIARYADWLHLRWPAGRVEALPEVQADGTTNVPGIFVAGDLTGVPLLKFSADTGAKAARRAAEFVRGRAGGAAGDLDLVIVGAGVSGMAAALEARKLGLRFEVIESAEPFSTLVNFPRGKPIFTYPTDMRPEGDLQFTAVVKEALVDEVRAQTRDISPRMATVDRVVRTGDVLETRLADGEVLRSPAVIVAIGRSGNYRKLNVPGEETGPVYNRLHDPKDFAGRDVLVVGGGDTAVESAVALAGAGARVTLAHRGKTLTRPKPENVAQLAAAGAPVLPDAAILDIGDRETRLRTAGTERSVAADAVFVMIGREVPLDFFRRSGVRIRNERTTTWWVTLVAFLLFCTFIYHWKTSEKHILPFWPFTAIGQLGPTFEKHNWFPHQIPAGLKSLGGAWADPSTLPGTLALSVGAGGFYYSLAYCLCVTLFGIRRIRKRRTPYIRWQTLTLIAVQLIPLFIVPYIVLPWIGHNGWFDDGVGKWLADQLFPVASYDPQGREYWRAFGLVLAWPLFFWNVFSSQPMWLWLAISLVQTFVIIPLIVLRWGKGAYCGWICSCGALAETMGDDHRHKMPHGVWPNRLNFVGQAFLVFAFVLLALRVAGWMGLGFASGLFEYLFHDLPLLNYVWFVDVLWAGILGVGLYFWFSGRVWCRFGCPLAALMHIYARFGQFRILADKKKCISCNVCTTVCHQGIDVMSFANKGEPMADPQCVRCSACVQSCPTGVLSFGRVGRDGRVLGVDTLAASPVRMIELTVNGRKLAH